MGVRTHTYQQAWEGTCSQEINGNKDKTQVEGYIKY